MPASRSVSCGRCSSERISDPARTTRLKLTTSPATTASGRARPARGARATLTRGVCARPAGGVRTAGPALPAGEDGPGLPGGGSAPVLPAGGTAPARPAGGADPAFPAAAADPATSTTGRTGRMHGEMPAKNPATTPTTTSTTMPLPLRRTTPESARSLPSIRCRPHCCLGRPADLVAAAGQRLTAEAGGQAPAGSVPLFTSAGCFRSQISKGGAKRSAPSATTRKYSPLSVVAPA